MTVVHRQVEREAASWLARRDAGAWAARQQAAFHAWLAESAAHRVAFLRLEAAWEQTGRLKALVAGEPQDRPPRRGAWKQSPYFAALLDGASTTTEPMAARMPPGPAHHRRRRGMPVALAACAMLALVVVAGMGWRAYTHVDRAEWQTSTGGREVVQLADGSVATLGGDTRLRAALSRGQRDLYLPRGEAFLDVAHDPRRPFVVHAAGYRVTAVGTRFDVRRGPGEQLRVVVTRGLVRLQPAHDGVRTPTMLPAGSVALVDGTGIRVQRLSPGEARDQLGWRNGHAVFHGTPLADAVADFNRYNARKIVVADRSLDALRIGGNFRLDNGMAFVRLLQQVFPIDAEQRGDEIVLTRRPDRATTH